MPQLRPRVLCVDDDRDACEMLTVLMNTYGIEATCVSSAEEAWLKVKAESFDLYLLDGWLPGQDGFGFCHHLRLFDTHTPILFYSGAAYDTDRQRGMAAGANAYVIKPDVAGLMKTVMDLIAKAKVDKVVDPWAVESLAPAEISYPTQYLNLGTAVD